MTGQGRTTSWPEPYLQPDRTQDCAFYATAYIGRCLGLDVAADDVKAWRAETNRHEDHYLNAVHGVPMRRFWEVHGIEVERKRFWMGPDQREWVAEQLADQIAHVNVFRIPTMGHAVVALEARDEGVLLMDPIYGHVVEPWDWFLGVGAGTHGCHFLSVLYPKEARHG